VQVKLLKNNITAVVGEWEQTLSAQREAVHVAESCVADLRNTLRSILRSLADPLDVEV
jgi:hypothetical protein